MAVTAVTTNGVEPFWLLTRRKEAQKARWLDTLSFKFSIFAFCLFCLRDGLTAAIRYLLDMVGLGLLWFIPDLLAFVSLALFIMTACIRDKQPIAMLMVAAFVISILTSMVFFSGDAVVVFSGIKMFMPMIVGFNFRGRSVFEWKWAKAFLWVVFTISVVGVLLNPYVAYPWTGFSTTNAFGVTRTAQTLWWTGGVTRYGGFAGDSTMAAFMILFSYIMLSRHTNILVNVLCWAPCLWAIQVTTSKTALGLFFLYIAVYLMLNLVPRSRRLPVVRLLTASSFICILMPPVLMMTLGGVDLGAVSPNLASLADRINNTWGGPFLAVSDLFPLGLFTGCGLGCFSYPMKYSQLVSYYLPLDNFYLTTMLEMGYPFIIFTMLLLAATQRMGNMVKLLLLLNWNIYSITVQGYGPSYATLVYGYAVSEVFLAGRRQKQRQPTM